MNPRETDPMTPEQSERALRAARLIAAAGETFGSHEKAAIWLRRRTTALAGDTPLDLLATNEGTRKVEMLLGRIEHGIAS